MKRALSILLLIVFLFNVGGYYIVFSFLQYQSSQKIISIIDSGSYENHDMVEIKIPVSLPYPVSDRGFERIKGKFELNGEHFQLVKQKFENDTLYIICVKNHDVKQLENTMNEYVKLTNELPGASEKALSFVGKLLKEYNSGSQSPFFAYNPFAFLEINYVDLESFDLIDRPIEIASPPPRS